MSIFKGKSGEPVEGTIPADDEKFLKEVAYPRLDGTTDPDVLKNFADAWWNLCQWEKQRADVLDGKAQSLVGLASIASAVVAATGPVVGVTPCITWLRVLAVLAFLVTAVMAVMALRIAKYPGFLDADVFAALAINDTKNIVPKYTDLDKTKSYYRELAMQRWVIYRGFKRASESKASSVFRAQIGAIASVGLLVVLIGAAAFGC